MLELEKYPPGVQDLLRWAGYHLEQLELLEREFRAWEAGQGETSSVSYDGLLQLPMLSGEEGMQRLQVGTRSRAEEARRQWEARMRGGG